MQYLFMELNQGSEKLLLYEVLVGYKYVLAVSRDLESTKNIKYVPNKPTLKKCVIKTMRIVYLVCFFTNDWKSYKRHPISISFLI